MRGFVPGYETLAKAGNFVHQLPAQIACTALIWSYIDFS